MDADLVRVPADPEGRMHGDALHDFVAQMAGEDRDRVFAVVATSGTTNAGVIDDLAGTADVADDNGWWFHVDGAYGAAALCSPRARPMFTGIERCDSLIVDPHKWLFAPFDCCALLYADPEIARAAHTQHAEYLDVLHDEQAAALEWNPSDYAHHLSRRARGLPFWFSLATYGTDAYAKAVDTTLDVAREAAGLVGDAEHLDLIAEPQLSIVMFRRRGWDATQYQAWSDAQLLAGESFVVPSAWDGETVLRFCFVNPLTTIEQVAEIIESLR